VLDPTQFAGQRVLLVGGGDSAFDWAVNLQGIAKSVMLIHRRDAFRAHQATVNQVQEFQRCGKCDLRTFWEVKALHGNGINQLSILTQYPVIFFVSRKVNRGYYEYELIKIAEPPYDRSDFRIVENYVKATEKIIREQPEGWLWSHNRWKNTREEMKE